MDFVYARTAKREWGFLVGSPENQKWMTHGEYFEYRKHSA